MDTISERITGYQVTTRSQSECLDLIESWLAGRGDGPAQGRYFACANPHSLEVARGDAEFSRALAEADLVVPDGIGVVLASKILNGAIRERVTGMMLFLGICRALNERGGSVYFLGSTRDTLERIVSRLASDYPHLRVAGMCAPPFAEEFPPEIDDRMVKEINRARPDVLWVGMTAPKQEKWILRNRERIEAGVLGPIGAAFDFYAGTVVQPSPWFREHGLEWLPRLLRQPGKLWRRNLVSNPTFLARVILGRLAGRSVKRQDAAPPGGGVAR
jgi:N-acetylglucosaminyldiphosphoundecaprenol N-acetyl-beta-D-mannosaminyltransferase